jgi:hypothetical protein
VIETAGQQAVRAALVWSMSEQRRTGELPPIHPPAAALASPVEQYPPPTPGKTAMDGYIDPQEFGELRAQVRLLLEQDKLKTQMLSSMNDTLQAMRLQMAEAKGGWKLLMLLGGSASALGSALTWFLTNWPKK